eukprot:COSAG04_NODE_4928_length_1821_cov_1.026713_1_plen_76_part_10
MRSSTVGHRVEHCSNSYGQLRNFVHALVSFNRGSLGHRVEGLVEACLPRRWRVETTLAPAVTDSEGNNLRAGALHS